MKRRFLFKLMINCFVCLGFTIRSAISPLRVSTSHVILTLTVRQIKYQGKIKDTPYKNSDEQTFYNCGSVKEDGNI